MPRIQNCSLTLALLVPALLVAIAGTARPQAPAAAAKADDAKKAATKKEANAKDHLAIEGTWRAVSIEVNGNAVNADDVRKVTTENGRDGEWTLLVDGNEMAEGTSTIDATATPKTIDFKVTKGNDAGRETYGIYEFTGDTRKICYAEPGRPRPSDFSAPAGSGRILAVFERVKEK